MIIQGVCYYRISGTQCSGNVFYGYLLILSLEDEQRYKKRKLCIKYLLLLICRSYGQPLNQPE